jgi:tryptophan-rich sensory protein
VKTISIVLYYFSLQFTTAYVFLPRKKKRWLLGFHTSTLAAAVICLVFVVYDRESTGPRLLSLLLRWREWVGTSNLRLASLKGP